MVQIELGKLQTAKDEVERKKAKDAIDAILKMRELVGDSKIEIARIAADLLTKMQDINQAKAKAGSDAAVTLVKAAVSAASARETALERSKKNV
jgi:hypothetical protein